MQFLSLLVPKSFSDLILLFVFVLGILYLLVNFLSDYFSFSFEISRKDPRKRETTDRVVLTEAQRQSACNHENGVVLIEVPEEGENWQTVMDYDHFCVFCKKRSSLEFAQATRGRFASEDQALKAFARSKQHARPRQNTPKQPN
jgi:hypothetical protein